MPNKSQHPDLPKKKKKKKNSTPSSQRRKEKWNAPTTVPASLHLSTSPSHSAPAHTSVWNRPNSITSVPASNNEATPAPSIFIYANNGKSTNIINHEIYSSKSHKDNGKKHLCRLTADYLRKKLVTMILLVPSIYRIFISAMCQIKQGIYVRVDQHQNPPSTLHPSYPSSSQQKKKRKRRIDERPLLFPQEAGILFTIAHSIPLNLKELYSPLLPETKF